MRALLGNFNKLSPWLWNFVKVRLQIYFIHTSMQASQLADRDGIILQVNKIPEAMKLHQNMENIFDGRNYICVSFLLLSICFQFPWPAARGSFAAHLNFSSNSLQFTSLFPCGRKSADGSAGSFLLASLMANKVTWDLDILATKQIQQKPQNCDFWVSV